MCSGLSIFQYMACGIPCNMQHCFWNHRDWMLWPSLRYFTQKQSKPMHRSLYL